MQAQRQGLLSTLEEHGWRIVSHEEQLQWWADEMWLIESTWSPVGRLAYVTFLVDPQSQRDRKKGENVWAIMASSTKPESMWTRNDKFTMTMNRGWKESLPAFLEYLASLAIG